MKPSLTRAAPFNWLMVLVLAVVLFGLFLLVTDGARGAPI